MSSVNIPASYYNHEGVKLTLVQKALTAKWCELLKIERANIEDNFISMGGDSLAATLLLEYLTQQFGVEHSVDEFLSDPTLVGVLAGVVDEMTSNFDNVANHHQLADEAPSGSHKKALEKKATGKSREHYVERYISGQILPLMSQLEGPGALCVVELRGGGDQPPLFLVHPGGGTVHCYKLLIDRLDSGYPVYGLQSPAISPGTPPFRTVEEMASLYIDAIKTIQPRGPYRVVGWSAGGVFCFEIGQQLVGGGDQIGHIGMVDTAYLFPQNTHQVGIAARAKAVFDNVREFGLSNVFCGYRRYGESQRSILRNFREQGLGSRQRVVQTVARLEEQFEQERNPLVQASRLISIAVATYSPRRYHGPITFYRSQMFKKVQTMFGPWDIHWHRVSGSNLQVVDIAGNHVSVVYPPDVDVLAAALNKDLAESSKSLD